MKPPFFMFIQNIKTMADKKVYSIVINGVQESVNAVESLNKQLSELENRIKALEKSNIKINASSSGSGSASSGSKSSLNEEEKLAKQIEQIDAKREAYSKEIYQNYLAAKDVLDETVKDQKQISAQERLQANNYTNTMAGMKQELKDLKTVMNGTDLGDDVFKQMSQRARELTNKLKEIEQAYGQFGRNVGNYQSAFQGLDKLTIEVGGVAREFGSAREAAKTFKNELTALEIQGKGNTEEAKELRKAYYQLTSAMDDATKSSKAMDEAMDWMTSFTAMASVGNGLKAFFGFDDNEITKSIQKLVALQNVLNGIESMRKQMETGEGIGAILSKGSQGVDKFVASITGAQLGVEGLTKGSRLATVAVRSLSIAMKGLGIGLVIAAISALVEVVQKAGTAIQDYFKGNAELMDSAHLATAQIEAENNAFKQQKAIVSSRYMQGLITDYEYAVEAVYNLTDALKDNITAMHEHMGEVQGSLNALRAFREGLSGNLQNGKGIKIESDIMDFPTLINNLDDAKKAFREFSLAVKKDMDIVESMHGWFGGSLGGFLSSFIVSADDAKDDLVQIGQAIAGDWVKRMNEVDRSTATTEKSLQELRKQVKPLIDEFNNDAILRTILMNLDKYFPDEEIKARIKNVVDYAQQLSDGISFMSKDKDVLSKEGYNYWEQVSIDALKDGSEKIIRQIKLNKKKEEEALVSQYGMITKERQEQLDNKYARLQTEQLKQIGQQQRDAENDLINLRLQMMKEGFEKEKAQLDQERKEKIQKVVQSGILVGKRTEAINNLYDKKIADAKKKWAADILKTYQDLYQNIQQLNRATFNMEGDNASTNVENRRTQQKQDAGYSMINSENFDDSKSLEEYYKKVLEIEKKASEQQAQIQQERLDKELEYNKQEEKLRHERLVNTENGEYKQQLEAGKITQEQYDKLMEDEKEAHNARMNALDVEYTAQSTKVVQDQCEEQQRLYSEYYGNIINDIKKDKQKVDEVISKQPVVDKNGWGVVNIGKTSDNYKTSLEQYDNLKKEIIKKQQELDAALKAKTISPEDFAMKQSELKQEVKAIDEAVKQVQEKQKQLIGDFMQSISQYIQAGMQSIQDILSAVWDAQDTQFEKEQEFLDKLNDELDKKLDEQQDIVQQHKDAIDSIEDELATARGGRRQHLIDQINAEIEAQRAARAEEKRLQKEKERAEKKQEELEKKRKKAEYERSIVQIILNGAMAVSMAAVNSWPVPAIPMMALAAASTAAQLAIALSNKPYAKGGQLDGGVAQGNRHRDGGIKVLGGRAEIEGGEYITNRLTTSKNIDLLDYINSKKKKIDINDLMDFYSSTPRKTIRAVRTKFEDGGYLPTLPNALDVRDQLQNVVVNQDNRPIYVSVVDINNKQEDVRRVQTLAGL